MSLFLHSQLTSNDNKPVASAKLASGDSIAPQGIISEVVYREGASRQAHSLLLPLLRQLGEQSRWQLWLPDQHKLNRQWLHAADLPVTKIIQAQFGQGASTLAFIEKALFSGNFSVVIWWSSQSLTSAEHQRLAHAAEQGNAMGLIMRSESIGRSTRPLSGLKIHSGLYH